MRISIALWSLLLILATGCTPKTADAEEDKAAIEAAYNKYVKAVADKDLDSFMEVWMDDGMRAEPGLPLIVGKENIRKRFEQVFTAADYKITPIGDPLLEVSGDMAFSLRTVTLSTVPIDSSPELKIDMKVLSIMKRMEDGTWKCYIDCVNTHPSWSMDSIPEGMEDDNPYY